MVDTYMMGYTGLMKAGSRYIPFTILNEDHWDDCSQAKNMTKIIKEERRKRDMFKSPLGPKNHGISEFE